MGGNQRIKSIDILRGMTIAFMVVASNPGSRNVFSQLRHASWEGITAVDFAFPAFILTMAMAIPIVIDKASRTKTKFQVVISIIRRSIMLFFMGIVLNALPSTTLSTIRIMGVLQRLGIVYLVVSLFYLVLRNYIKDNRRLIFCMLFSSSALLVFYSFLLHPMGYAIDSNLASTIDIKINMHKELYDPEGLISTLGAIVTGMLGCSVGFILKQKEIKHYTKFLSILTLGTLLVIIAHFLSFTVPYNKKIWTSSFVLITAGYPIIILSIVYYLSDIMGKDKFLKPFIYFGSNPIFIYVTMEFIRKYVWPITITDLALGDLNLNTWLTNKFFTPLVGVKFESITFSLLYLLLWFLIASIMYKRKIFIKI